MTEDDLNIEVMPDSFEGVIELNNGQVVGEVALGDAHHELANIVGADAADQLCWEVTKYQKKVDEARLQGVALGSTDLRNAVDSLYYDPQRTGEVKDPKTFGLETERELKLAAHVMSSFVKAIDPNNV